MGSVTGWSQNTLLSQGCILETALTMGTVEGQGDGEGDSQNPSPALGLTGNHVLLMCLFWHPAL